MQQPYFPACDRPLRDAYDTALLDLDGVVYIGKHAVPEAVPAINDARAHGMRIAYVTNNAARPAAEVALHLSQIGLATTAADVVTSAQAGAHLMQQYLPAGAKVFALGGPGVALSLSERGFTPVGIEDVADAQGVLQGFGPDLTWHWYAAGTQALVRGAVWVATNMDFTIPTPGGIAPGNGSFVRLIGGAAGREPVAIGGKPERALIDESIERVGAQRPLIIGDRLDTDIWAGHNAGVPSLLVLTGVSTPSDVLRAVPQQRPTYLGRDLRALAEPQREVEMREGFAHCGDATARIHQGNLEVQGSDPVAMLKVAAVCAWSDPGARIDDAVTKISSALG